jgi:hemolysin-activating ACP:hemolysin acyltransferase
MGLSGHETGLQPWQPASEAEFLGFAVQLMQASTLHCRWYVSDFERLVVPPYRLQQYRCYRVVERAAGLVTWAYLSEQCANELAEGTRKMQPGDWRCGKQFWIIDVLAPYGDVWSIVSDLRRIIHVGHGFALRRNPNGTIKRRITLYQAAHRYA